MQNYRKNCSTRQKKNSNAPANISTIATGKLVDLGCELPLHPPYSPYLTPRDFFLFLNLKRSIAGQKFKSNEKVIATMKVYFAYLQETFFSNGSIAGSTK